MAVSEKAGAQIEVIPSTEIFERSMTPDFVEQVVVITGASRGLGAELAVNFAQAGARVSLCARNVEGLERTAAAVRHAGGECLVNRVDISNEAEVEAWIRRTERLLGIPTVLINNASILGPRTAVADYPLEEWRTVMEINLTGAFIVTQAVLPGMLKSGRGSIINVSSGAAIPPRAEWGAYAISKLALDGFSQNLARELEGAGIRVNSVDPGAMRTEMRSAAYPQEDPQTVKPPRAATAVFLWLASDASVGITGQRLQADRFEAPSSGTKIK